MPHISTKVYSFDRTISFFYITIPLTARDLAGLYENCFQALAAGLSSWNHKIFTLDTSIFIK